MDDMLDCLCVKWERHGENNVGRDKGKVFALCPFDSVRGGVHIVRANAFVDMLHDTLPCKATVEQHEV